MTERLCLSGLETGSEWTDTGGLTLGLDKTWTNLPEYSAELNCLNSELKLDSDVTALYNYKTDPSNPQSLLGGKSDFEKVLLEIRSMGTFLSQPHF